MIFDLINTEVWPQFFYVPQNTTAVNRQYLFIGECSLQDILHGCLHLWVYSKNVAKISLVQMSIELQNTSSMYCRIQVSWVNIVESACGFKKKLFASAIVEGLQYHVQQISLTFSLILITFSWGKVLKNLK